MHTIAPPLSWGVGLRSIAKVGRNNVDMMDLKQEMEHNHHLAQPQSLILNWPVNDCYQDVMFKILLFYGSHKLEALP